MYRFLQSKKGFTLVELVIVLMLLSLGALAVMNLITAGWRAFSKTEERFVKQEAVKNAVEFLQMGTDVGAATTAACFATTKVVPNGTVNEDKSNTWLYSEMVDQDNDGTYDGYILKIKEAGAADAIIVSPEPLYVQIKPYIDWRTNVRDVTKPKEYLPAAIVSIMALDGSFDYGTPDAPNVPTSDDIYYKLDVMYHFPNMANSENNIGVNQSTKSWTFDTANTYSQDSEHLGEEVTGGMVYATHRIGDNEITYTVKLQGGATDEGKITTNLPASEAANDTLNKGVVLRMHIDSIIKGGNVQGQPKVPTLCFIASASYGQNSGEVGLLCDFRDNVLKGTALGDAFIKAYYTVSPPIAKLIQKSPALAAAVRVLLKPLVLVATYALDRDLLAQNAVWLVTFGLCGLGSSATLVVLSKRLRREKRHGN
ncbi:MAG: prepilin-type N-terminal cleavage/methylation domain-containing protein [Clostridia bacterium]|nr:prepilin-type N-terminal cleavage/methylation domain-containing protein [Clostridia bacterium]